MDLWIFASLTAKIRGLWGLIIIPLHWLSCMHEVVAGMADSSRRVPTFQLRPSVEERTFRHGQRPEGNRMTNMKQWRTFRIRTFFCFDRMLRSDWRETSFFVSRTSASRSNQCALKVRLIFLLFCNSVSSITAFVLTPTTYCSFHVCRRKQRDPLLLLFDIFCSSLPELILNLKNKTQQTHKLGILFDTRCVSW